LDLVGAYLKNYMIDKADAVMGTIMPICRNKGKLWKIKALNFYAAIRAKQSRYQDSLAFLQELQENLDLGESEEGAWQVYDMLYRNFGVTYEGLGLIQKAQTYFQKAANVKINAGLEETWFDLWDIGRVKSIIAFQSNAINDIESALATVKRSLHLHQRDEPNDKVMSAKILHSLGECHVALALNSNLNDRPHVADGSRVPDHVSASLKEDRGERSRDVSRTYSHHLLEALNYFNQSHILFKRHKGPHNPLTGREASSVASVLMHLTRYDQAKPYLLDALITAGSRESAWGDVSDSETVTQVFNNVLLLMDRILNAHRETEDRQGLSAYFGGVTSLLTNVRSRGMDSAQPDKFEALLFKSAMLIIASGAVDYRERALALIGDAADASIFQTQMLNTLVTSLKTLPGE